MNKNKEYFETSMAVVMIIIVILAIIFNFLVLIGLTRRYHEKRLRDYVLLSMSISDSIRILFSGTLEITGLLRHQIYYNHTACKATAFITEFLEFVAMGHLLLLVIDRYLCICKSDVALKLYASSLYCCVYIISIYFYACTWAVLPFLGLGEYGTQSGGVQCGLLTLSNEKSKINICLILVFVFIIPVIVMLFCVNKILRKIQRMNKVTTKRVSTVRAPTLAIQDKHQARFIIAIYLIFTISWLPYYITLAEEIFQGNSNEYAEVTTICMGHSTAFTLPMLHIFFYTELRKTLKQLALSIYHYRCNRQIHPQRNLST